MMFFVTLIASSRMMPSITRLSFDEFLDAKQYEFELHDAACNASGDIHANLANASTISAYSGILCDSLDRTSRQVRRRESRSRNGLDDVRELGAEAS